MFRSRPIILLLIPVAIAMAFLASRFASAQRTTNGDAMSGATLRSLTPPVYPPLARQAAITGDVIVKVSLRADGTVESVTPVSGHPMLVQAAVSSAEQSKFECVACAASGSTQSFTYSFEQSPEKPDPCCCSGNRPASTRSDIQVLQSADHITVIAAPVCICPDVCTEKWAEEQSHFRSPKCLYLWKCGHRKISIL
jgi:TonB family protein